MKTSVYTEYKGNKVSSQQIIDDFKEIWKSKGHRIKDLATVEFYFKPEEEMCYYVANGDVSGSFRPTFAE